MMVCRLRISWNVILFSLKKALILFITPTSFIDEQNNSIRKPFVVLQQINFNKMLASSIISCSTSFIKTELMHAHPFNPDFYYEDSVYA